METETFRLDLPTDRIRLHSGNPVILDVGPGGAVTAKGPFRYPDFYVQVKDVEKILQSRLPFSNKDQWPVVCDDSGFWTDTRWGVFQSLSTGKKTREFIPTYLLEAIASGAIPWQLKCPALEGPESVIGCVLHIYGHHIGGIPGGDSGYNPESNMLKFPATCFIRKAAASKLVEFRDHSRSLLDMACEYQQWELADVLWKKGVRWSENDLEKGVPLQSLIVSWNELRQSGVLGWLKGESKEESGDLRQKWLATWLARYEGLHRPMPQKACLDWHWRTAVIRGSGEGDLPYFDTPYSFFVRHLFHRSGFRVVGPDLMLPHGLQMFKQWLVFWAKQKVDITNVSVPVSASDPPMSFSDYWAQAPTSKAWVKSHWLEQQLPPSDPLENLSPSSSSRPRL